MKETELIRRRVKEPSIIRCSEHLLKKVIQCHYAKCELHTHMLKMLSRWVQCVMTGVFLEQFLLIKWSTVLLLPAHITGEPLRSVSPATFSNVRVHVRAIWRITWWQLQARLSRKVSSPNRGPQMPAGLWNAERCELWINSCWHHCCL